MLKKKKKTNHDSKAIILCPPKTVNLFLLLEYFKTDANSD